MPKFSFTSGFNLKDVLSELGMPDAFSEQADFSGMDGTHNCGSIRSTTRPS